MQHEHLQQQLQLQQPPLPQQQQQQDQWQEQQPPPPQQQQWEAAPLPAHTYEGAMQQEQQQQQPAPPARTFSPMPLRRQLDSQDSIPALQLPAAQEPAQAWRPFAGAAPDASSALHAAAPQSGAAAGSGDAGADDALRARVAELEAQLAAQARQLAQTRSELLRAEEEKDDLLASAAVVEVESKLAVDQELKRLASELNFKEHALGEAQKEGARARRELEAQQAQLVQVQAQAEAQAVERLKRERAQSTAAAAAAADLHSADAPSPKRPRVSASGSSSSHALAAAAAAAPAAPALGAADALRLAHVPFAEVLVAERGVELMQLLGADPTLPPAYERGAAAAAAATPAAARRAICTPGPTPLRPPLGSAAAVPAAAAAAATAAAAEFAVTPLPRAHCTQSSSATGNTVSPAASAGAASAAGTAAAARRGAFGALRRQLFECLRDAWAGRAGPGELLAVLVGFVEAAGGGSELSEQDVARYSHTLVSAVRLMQATLALSHQLRAALRPTSAPDDDAQAPCRPLCTISDATGGPLAGAQMDGHLAAMLSNDPHTVAAVGSSSERGLQRQRGLAARLRRCLMHAFVGGVGAQEGALVTAAMQAILTCTAELEPAELAATWSALLSDDAFHTILCTKFGTTAMKELALDLLRCLFRSRDLFLQIATGNDAHATPAAQVQDGAGGAAVAPGTPAAREEAGGGGVGGQGGRPSLLRQLCAQLFTMESALPGDASLYGLYTRAVRLLSQVCACHGSVATSHLLEDNDGGPSSDAVLRVRLIPKLINFISYGGGVVQVQQQRSTTLHRTTAPVTSAGDGPPARLHEPGRRPLQQQRTRWPGTDGSGKGHAADRESSRGALPLSEQQCRVYKDGVKVLKADGSYLSSSAQHMCPYPFLQC
ncbi:hypothetical protein JKP88DRAFT_350293 [Tribonema minus]|uniref:Uncharacterized protein n=1 Tax=Tribonema minus TaxID=303371 RepID=A0A836C9U6_9STRA|nr:hypothetical protein JKP88DRAFT_350293 [Tribonema minus]